MWIDKYKYFGWIEKNDLLVCWFVNVGQWTTYCPPRRLAALGPWCPWMYTETAPPVPSRFWSVQCATGAIVGYLSNSTQSRIIIIKSAHISVQLSVKTDEHEWFTYSYYRYSVNKISLFELFMLSLKGHSAIRAAYFFFCVSVMKSHDNN